MTNANINRKINLYGFVYLFLGIQIFLFPFKWLRFMAENWTGVWNITKMPNLTLISYFEWLAFLACGYIIARCSFSKNNLKITLFSAGLIALIFLTDNALITLGIF